MTTRILWITVAILSGLLFLIFLSPRWFGDRVPFREREAVYGV